MGFSDFGRHSDDFGTMWDFVAPQNHYSEYSPFGRPRQVPVHCSSPPYPPSKVFSVPVQFFRPESDRSYTAAAVKIQKAFRGFMARKIVRKIAEIKIEVEEIERQISRKETVELIRREAKERLRLDETLMRLLLRLDTVKGFDSGVREFRKSVNNKVIALQDRVDATVAAVDGGDGDETLEEVGEDSGWESISEIAYGIGAVEMEGGQIGEKPQIDETLELQSASPEADGDWSNPSYKPRNSTKYDNADGECAMEIAKAEREENKRSRELLERVVEDNKKMMVMMMQLFEKNEKQTRMLSSLANRVDQMERAIACDRMRRRKKRNDAAAAGDFLVWRSPDHRGRRL